MASSTLMPLALVGGSAPNHCAMMACSSGVKSSTEPLLCLVMKNPPSVDRGGLTVRATRFVADLAASPFGRPPCPGRQVGEGVSPALDAPGYVVTATPIRKAPTPHGGVLLRMADQRHERQSAFLSRQAVNSYARCAVADESPLWVELRKSVRVGATSGTRQ